MNLAAELTMKPTIWGHGLRTVRSGHPEPGRASHFSEPQSTMIYAAEDPLCKKGWPPRRLRDRRRGPGGHHRGARVGVQRRTDLGKSPYRSVLQPDRGFLAFNCLR